MSVKHQIIFLRHGRTSYSGIYPDITEEGREQLIQAAKKFRPFFSHQSFTKKIFITSPAVRAKGSGDILAKELQFEEEIFEEELLSDMHVFNWSKAKKIFNDCLENGKLVEEIYDFDPRFEDESIFEPRTNIRGRFFQYMKNILKTLQQEKDSYSLVAVTHFEILNHFLQDLWPEAPWLRSGDGFRMSIQDQDLSIHYRDFIKTIDPLYFTSKEDRSKSKRQPPVSQVSSQSLQG